jgi:cytochrome c oxidase cbb3-type subunit 4
MTQEFLQGVGTITAFVAFGAICAWAYSSRRKADFDQAAQLPFADDAPQHEHHEEDATP